MGQEVGWTLRFSQVKEVEALIMSSALSQVQSLLHIEPEWRLEVEKRPDDLVLARLKRKSSVG